jgi:hypothetical protein
VTRDHETASFASLGMPYAKLLDTASHHNVTEGLLRWGPGIAQKKCVSVFLS